MYKDRSRRVIPIIIVIIIIVLAIFAIVSLGRAIFSGGSATTQQTTTTAARDTLLNIGASHGVRLTVRGKIVGDESYRSYIILITPQQRVMTTYRGYLESPITTKSYDNNTQAYEQFVYALDKAGFVTTATLTESQNDTRGLCASGNILDYDILNDNTSVAHMWTTTCKDTNGSMRGSGATIKSLFSDQIPDYTAIIATIHK